MKRKELTKIFMMILNWKQPFVFRGLYTPISPLQGLTTKGLVVSDFTEYVSIRRVVVHGAMFHKTLLRRINLWTG